MKRRKLLHVTREAQVKLAGVLAVVHALRWRCSKLQQERLADASIVSPHCDQGTKRGRTVLRGLAATLIPSPSLGKSCFVIAPCLLDFTSLAAAAGMLSGAKASGAAQEAPHVTDARVSEGHGRAAVRTRGTHCRPEEMRKGSVVHND